MSITATMPEHRISKINCKDQVAFERYRCFACRQLLDDPVQVSCGDRFCKSCADEIAALRIPALCPQCEEELKEEDGSLVSILHGVAELCRR